MKSLLQYAVLAMAIQLISYSGLAYGDSSNELKVLQEQTEILKNGQQGIFRELKEIKDLLQGKRDAANAETRGNVLSIKGQPMKGSATATLTVFEFSDYQCAFCGKFFRETFPQIDEEYIKTGKLRYVIGAFPILSLHPQAANAAQAAHCAGDQGKFWDMHERLFRSQKNISADVLVQHAAALALDVPFFTECLTSEKYSRRIEAEFTEGQKAGVRGTPTFFVGRTEPNETQMRFEKVIRGAQPYATFKEVFERLLSEQQVDVSRPVL